MVMEDTGNIVIYESEGGDVRLDVRLENGNVWLTQQQMALLYGKAPSTINEHIGDIFDDKELLPEACRKKFGNSEFQQTAAEIIYSRADAEKEFMGLTTFKGSRPHLSDAVIAKNYLNEKELRSLGQLVSGYLDFAERKAERHEYMTMADWAKHLDNVLTMNGEQLLVGSGSVSHKEAVEKAADEYKKYQQRTLSDVERAYLDTIKMLEDKTEKKS
jgi:hypothetical protein